MPGIESKKGKDTKDVTRAKSNDEEEFVPDEMDGDEEEIASGDQEEVSGEDEDGYSPQEDVESAEDVDREESEGDEEEDNREKGGSDEEANDAEEIDDEENDEEAKPRGTKRSKASKSQSGSNKKQKASAKNGSGKSSKAVDTSKPNGAAEAGKVGSKHDEPRDPETRGSAERLPEVGQQVHWKALPGYVDGEVVEIVTKEKKVDGKKVKASEKDPRIVLKSNKSGKICVHKAEAVYFE